MSKLTIAGIGPGDRDNMTIGADRALQSADIIVGYTVYAELIRNDYPGKEFITTPMTKEVERCRIALDLARQGRNVVMICSGDSGIYGMAALICELRGERTEPEVEVIPGLTAACSGAAVLGAPLTHDFAVISLSDRLTFWEKIESRLAAAARAEQEAAKAAEEEATRAKQEAAKAAEAEAAAAEEARNEARRQQAAASCFVAGSPVATTDGERPISELAVGDRVITLDRDGKETVGVVTEVMTPREAEIVEVTFSNGAVWRTTESQTVWLGHEQNYEIKDDAVGKKALLRGGESVAVTSVKYTGKYETVYDVLVGEEEDEDVIFVAGIAAEGYFTKGERGR